MLYRQVFHISLNYYSIFDFSKIFFAIIVFPRYFIMICDIEFKTSIHKHESTINPMSFSMIIIIHVVGMTEYKSIYKGIIIIHVAQWMIMFFMHL